VRGGTASAWIAGPQVSTTKKCAFASAYPQMVGNWEVDFRIARDPLGTKAKMLKGRIRSSAEGAWTEGRCSEAEDHFSKVMAT
jgi:hypothetical protein